MNGTVKDDFSEFDTLRTSKKPGMNQILSTWTVWVISLRKMSLFLNFSKKKKFTFTKEKMKAGDNAAVKACC